MKIVLSISLTLILILVAAAAPQRDSQLSGYVRYNNRTAAKGVVLSVGSFSVTTDVNGYYRIGYLKPGAKMVSITPPGKPTKSFPVQVGANPTQRDFNVDW